MKIYLIPMIAVLNIFSALPASACGPRTLEVVKMMEKAKEPPLFRCGQEFNEVLRLAHAKDWLGALAAYEAHLKGIGSWEAGTEQATETLAYLKAMADSGKK